MLADASALRWRYGERLDDVLEDACRRFGDHTAVATDGVEIAYRELDARANQTARYLSRQGVRAGKRIGVLLDRGLESYVALFALLKLRAVYVPLDANHPAERINYILADAQATLVIAHLRAADALGDCPTPTLIFDKARDEIAAMESAPLRDDEREPSVDEGCYVLYTSGTTGHPKGVNIAHRSICNFVRVAAELYGFGPGERVYQGMSAAFDFSIEELWVPLIAGATLVPNGAPTSLFGEELADFLEANEITCLCCVPTLLASIERELPKLRILLIGGEACPQALVKRWSLPERVLLNSYGPTEATVTATLGRMHADKPVTIGRPLPTYSIVILDPRRDAALEMGEAGEIGIGGIGVAQGYLNRPELTQAKFIVDFLGLPNNLSGRIYRTGDVGRINEDGEIEFLGRIDSQVKLRGYRIELTEIEAVLLDIPEIAQVVATTFEPTPGAAELVAYYSVKHGMAAPSLRNIVALMRARLPNYMIPAFLEHLPFMPTLISNKTDREKLPAPKSQRLRLSESYAPPESASEIILCRALGETLNLEDVSIDGDFFNEYGAHSLLMARFCAKIRQIAPTMNIAMRDVYTNPNIRRLALAVDAAQRQEISEPDAPPAYKPSNLAYFGCGAAQMVFYVGAAALGVAIMQTSLTWTSDAPTLPNLYLRALTLAWGVFLGGTALAIAAKWALLGRVRASVIPLWGVAYFRFWAAAQILAAAPMNVFVGTPLYNLYLRLLGARVGRHAVIASSATPVAADLFSVGDHAVIAKRAMMTGYHVAGNRLHFGAIRIGAYAYVGETSVLDIGASIGDFGQLGHASTLQSGQSVPEGKRYHGAPAEETTTNFRLPDASQRSRLRAWAITLAQMFVGLSFFAAPAAVLATVGLSVWSRLGFAALRAPATAAGDLLPVALSVSLGFYALSLLTGLATIYVVPRLAQVFLREGRLYPLYGFRHSMQRIVETFSNSGYFNLLFGDSVFIEPYLRFVGWRLAPGDRTGSNFGASQSHDNPFLCAIGAGTVASDGLTLGNIAMSSQSFRLAECRVGARNFLGTGVYVPPGARLGDNCLLATKLMAPIDGPLRENIGLLGSPAFEIPRAASRDLDVLGRIDAPARTRQVKLKTRHNLATMGMMLGVHWFAEFCAIYLIALTAATVGARSFPGMFAAASALTLIALALNLFVERASIGFAPLKPEIATVYDAAFWRIERHWKLSSTWLAGAFAGTPMRSLVLRLLGVKVGRKVFDDGCTLTERTLVEIGDGANLNRECTIQAHSLEEGVFKSDYVRIGAGCTIGPAAFVHYGVVMNEATQLDADAFLMKGEITPAGSRWRGNPARILPRRAPRAL